MCDVNMCGCIERTTVVCVQTVSLCEGKALKSPFKHQIYLQIHAAGEQNKMFLQHVVLNVYLLYSKTHTSSVHNNYQLTSYYESA